MKIFLVLVAIFAITVIYYIGPITRWIDWEINAKCLSSHKEQEIKNAPSVVVGGSKYGGGVAIPIGNSKIVTVDICDEYESIENF